MTFVRSCGMRLAKIGELVPGIVAHELKPLRQELQQDIVGINDRLDTLEALYSNLKGVTRRSTRSATA